MKNVKDELCTYQQIAFREIGKESIAAGGAPPNQSGPPHRGSQADAKG